MEFDLRPWLRRAVSVALVLATWLACALIAPEHSNAQGQDAAEPTGFVRASTDPLGEKLTFGTYGDVLTPGDYDGDGKTDLAVWRPSTGAWWVYGIDAPRWGIEGDVPVPGDYDGDGKTDFAVYRPASSTWWIRGHSPIEFGSPGDVPIQGDYDGDGKADIAVFRESTSSWYLLKSSQVASSPASTAAGPEQGAVSAARKYWATLTALAFFLLVGAMLAFGGQRRRKADAALAAREVAVEGREGKVSRATAELTEREDRLKLHERLVEQLAMALDTRAGVLSAEADRLGKLRNDLGLAASVAQRRETELAAREADLARREAVLVERAAELAERKRDLEAARGMLAAQAESVDARIAELHSLRHEPSDRVRLLVARIAAARQDGASSPTTVATRTVARLVRRAAELALGR
jgi:hypothetical protein